MVSILTSGVGLGLYIPAVLIERRLRSLGVAADVEVIEGFYAPEYQRAHLAHRDAHHASFALAQLAHRMARGVDHCLDAGRIDALLAHWRREGRREFIVWAGFWLPVLERYRIMVGEPLSVDRCRIDAVVSASFKVHAELDRRGREIWLWSEARRRVEHEIPVGHAAPLPFGRREHRLIVHGGGWGIGTYRSTLPELACTPYALDVVLHHPAEAPPRRAGDRTLMLDPQWCVWTGEHGKAPAFPPMLVVSEGTTSERLCASEHHPMHDVIRVGKAIVSKPGGCTLIDSLASATPVVLLDAYGYGEEGNARLWRQLGFGIPYAAWRATGFDPAVLERLHDNILARARGVDYPRSYVERVAESCQ